VEGDPFLAESHASRLNLAEVKHIVNQFGQVLAVALDGGDVSQERRREAVPVDLR